MRRRILVLPLAAVVIAAACLYKLTRSYEDAAAGELSPQCAAADFAFGLPSQHQPPQFVKLEAYLGRHRAIVVFFDGERGAENDPVLVRLRELEDRLARNNVKVFGVSTAIPQQNRPPASGATYRTPNQPVEPFPFPLLSDLPPDCRVHRNWGRWDAARGRPLTGVFLIDPQGYLACDGGTPKPLDDPVSAIEDFLK